VKKYFVLVMMFLLLLSVVPLSITATASDFDRQLEQSGAGVLTYVNQQLAAQGLSVRAEAIEFYTIGGGRPSNRIHQQAFHWVPFDPNRNAQGDDITYIALDELANGNTASGLSAADTAAAIDRAMNTWNTGERCLSNVDIVKRNSPGGDNTIFDSIYGFGGLADGDIFAADIINAGWYPRAYFEAVGGPGGGRGILAFSVSFIFTDNAGNPTDINGDNYLDTALNEVYYNDTFGDPGNDRAGNPWGINIALPGIDVETVALHENGHSLGLGHFGPPPSAVMNPVYAGIKHAPEPSDHAGMCANYSSWPNR
jgi:hypothetical protein